MNMKGTKMSCQLYFVRWYSYTKSLEILFYVSSTASFQLACQMRFIFVDNIKDKITWNNILRQDLWGGKYHILF